MWLGELLGVGGVVCVCVLVLVWVCRRSSCQSGQIWIFVALALLGSFM
jgi:hypothetical protein